MGRAYDAQERAVMSATATTADFTVANATDIFTSTAHGLATNDVITVTNSGGALPTGMATNTYYWVTKINANTFYLSATKGGTNLDVSDDGSGTHSFWKEAISVPFNVTDYRHVTVSVDTADSAEVKLYAMASISYTFPTYGQAQTASNQWINIGCIDLQNVSGIDGDTGITVSGTDIHKMLSINTDGVTSVAFKTLNLAVGTVTIKLRGFN